MLLSNELFSVVESSPAAFVKLKQAIFHYSLIFILREEECLLLVVSPGFRPALPDPAGIKTIIQIVFSDFLIDFFHYQPLAFIGAFLRRSSGSRLLLSDALMRRVKDSIDGLRKAFGYESFEQIFRIMNMLASADDTITLTEVLPASADSSQVAGKINKIKNYVKENFRNPIKISEVAGITGFSNAHFCRFFRQHTGITFKDYLNIVRVEEAALILLKTDDTISGIAFSCGFNTPQYFNDVFKQYKGMTPGKARMN